MTTEKRDRILVIIESGVGNCCFLTSLIKSLHSVYNKPEITLLSSRYRKEGKILEGWFYLKNCIYSANDLDHKDFDKIFVSPMYGNNFNHFILNVPKDKIFSISLNQPINYFREHEVEVNMRIARKLGYEGATPLISVMTKKPKKVPKLDKKKIKIGFHTGCWEHPDYVKKLWLKNRWFRLAKKLTKQLNAQVIWFGATKDFSSKTVGLNLVNKFEDIRETAYMINKCDLFISLDSGNSHISNALFVPTISLFGPTLPSKNHPYNPIYSIIQSKICKECYFTERYRTCKENTCMSEITVDEVFNEAKKLLEYKTKKIKVFLVACRQLGDSLHKTLKEMDNVEVTYYDYIEKNYDFSEEANQCDLFIVLKGIRGVNPEFIKKVKIKKVLWFNDNVVRYREEFEGFRPLFDRIYTANKDNEKGTEQLLFGVDTSVYQDFKLIRDIDVSFAGNLNSKGRKQWKDGLLSSYPVKFFHDISNEKFIKLLNQSKISINQHYNIHGPNMRFFEAMGCKSLMLTDKVIGIPKNLKNGKHFVMYKSIPEAVRKIRYYLTHEKERKKIVDSAYEIVMKHHKYSDRFEELFRKVHLR